MAIPMYEQIQRAKKGEVFYTTKPARNATSAASRLGRKVTTEKCTVYSTSDRRIQSMVRGRQLVRVTVMT